MYFFRTFLELLQSLIVISSVLNIAVSVRAKFSHTQNDCDCNKQFSVKLKKLMKLMPLDSFSA